MSTMYYTGASDKNGTKIYKGDIVAVDEEKIGVVMYDDYECCYYVEFFAA